MSSTSNVLLVGAIFCVLMLLVLSSLLRSGVLGLREWCVANGLGGVALALYAYGQVLAPWLAYEAANGLYAAAAGAVLVGYQRFFGTRAALPAIGTGVALLVAAIAFFHYGYDSFALRTTAVSVFQAAIGTAIIIAVLRSRQVWRSRYPYYFTVAMAGVIVSGHVVRSIVYLLRTDEVTSLLQPTGWNLFFVSAGTFVLPVLTIGAVMMVHDTVLGRAEHAANRDFLTGAWSRRAFFELGEREFARAARSGRKLSLLLLDVDRFKHINDTWGHAIGDEVLKDAVGSAATAIRGVDILARVGGEEFGVLLPDTDSEEAAMVGERLRAALDRAQLFGAGRRAPVSLHYTVSAGLATALKDESMQDLMRRADAALYQAKASGRNRIVRASGAEQPAGETT